MASSSSAPLDDDMDYEEGLDRDPEDVINSVEGKEKEKVAQRFLRALTNEKYRRSDYEERLKKKLTKLDADLAEQREDVEALVRTLQREKWKDEDLQKGKRSEKLAKAQSQKKRIREHLVEVLYTKPSTKRTKKEVFELDTVKVSFIQSNKAIRFNLTFRVDENTKIRQLRDDVCKYWSVKPDEYILMTLSNSKCQSDILVKDCFKQGEIAQLRLERRKVDNTQVSEAESKAIQPKNQKNQNKNVKLPTRINTEGPESIHKNDSAYVADLGKMGGVYFLLRIHDPRPSEALLKIKLRDLIVFFCVIVLKVWCYCERRPPGEGYFSQRAFTMAFDQETAIPNAVETAPGYSSVTDDDDLWNFLTYTVPGVIYSDSNFSLGSYNELLGYVSIRVKDVKTPNPRWEYCEQFEEALSLLPNAMCYPAELSPDTEESGSKSSVGVYWDSVTAEEDAGLLTRGPANPSVWVSADENRDSHGIRDLRGVFQDYDPAGYSVNYRMSGGVDSADYYYADMINLKNQTWISDATRIVSLSLLAYNMHYDVFISTDILFEKDTAGGIFPSSDVYVFRPSYRETENELVLFIVELVLMLFAAYILVAVGLQEQKHKQRLHRAGMLYYVTLNGICDTMTVLAIVTSFSWRISLLETERNTREIIDFVQDTGKTNGFQSYSTVGYQSEMIFGIDGLTVVFASYRLTSLFRLKPSFYFIWHMMGMALKHFLFHLMMIGPLLVDFVFLSHLNYSMHSIDFQTLPRSMVGLYDIFRGVAQFETLSRASLTWTLALYLANFFLVEFLFLAAFAEAVTSAYYRVKLTMHAEEGVRDWMDWIFPTVITTVFKEAFSQKATQDT